MSSRCLHHTHKEAEQQTLTHEQQELSRRALQRTTERWTTTLHSQLKSNNRTWATGTIHNPITVMWHDSGNKKWFQGSRNLATLGVQQGARFRQRAHQSSNSEGRWIQTLILRQIETSFLRSSRENLSEAAAQNNRYSYYYFIELTSCKTIRHPNKPLRKKRISYLWMR